MTKTKYSNLSDEALDALYKEKEDYIDSLWNREDMLPFDEYCKEVDKTDIVQIGAEKNLRKTPVFREASDFDLECQMKFEDFKTYCKTGMLISSDGSGSYGTETQVSDIYANPICFYNDWNRTDFNYIYWYNK